MTRRILVGFALVVLLSAAFSFDLYRAPVALSAPAAQAPTGSPTAQPTLSPGERSYTVEAGDNLWSIAQKMYGNGAKYPLILSANNLNENTKLRIGMVLTIPPLTATQPGPTVMPTPVSPIVPTPVASILTPTVPSTVVASRTDPSSIPTSPAAAGPTQPGGSSAANVTSQAILAALDVLSAVFAASSIICAFLAYQSYVRAKRLERMIIIRRRARGHADLF